MLCERVDRIRYRDDGRADLPTGILGQFEGRFSKAIFWYGSSDWTFFGIVDITLFPYVAHPAPRIADDGHPEAATAQTARFTFYDDPGSARSAKSHGRSRLLPRRRAAPDG